MQGDRLPYSVSALGCHLMLQTKFSSSVGTVHFGPSGQQFLFDGSNGFFRGRSPQPNTQ
jgi:hypothetical protein